MVSDPVMSDAAASDWGRLSDELQLVLAGSALRRAAETLARQAETLAGEMEAGALSDYGGVEALRLFAAIARLAGREAVGVAGHA